MMPPVNVLRSYGLVGIQLVCLASILLTGPLLASRWTMLGLEFAGIFLGVWALVTMTPRSLNVLPEIRPGSMLVTDGPYRYVRHPMYTALLVTTLALILDVFSLERLIMWILLFVDLWFKLRYEEQLLARHFEGYRDYQGRTKRLVPFLI